ncbi:hypothetical protein GCM10010330_45610 [Streptomyces tendae]|nr:hypothetical protein GCM10010330_45610 [Streptomyces tendae]
MPRARTEPGAPSRRTSKPHTAKNAAVSNPTPTPAIPHATRVRRNPPATTTDASNNAPPNGTHAYRTPAGPERTASPLPGFNTTLYVRPFATATESSITTRSRACDPADTGEYGPLHVPPPHRVTSTVPCSRPLVSNTCCAVPHDAHTPAIRINAATVPIDATRPNRNRTADAEDAEEEA